MTDVDDDGGRALLRGLPVLTGGAPAFPGRAVPEEPTSLFRAWLDHAIRAGVTEPHAMTLSTVGGDGFPDARVLILKAVDRAGWHFAASSSSTKGRDLARHPAAALTFYWPQLVRQVRVRGSVVDQGPAAARADFRARSHGSRCAALTGRQSHPLLDPGELDDALRDAEDELRRRPDLVPDEWVSYAVDAWQVEFWQGDPQRRHQRLRYELGATGWTRTRLWP